MMRPMKTRSVLASAAVLVSVVAGCGRQNDATQITTQEPARSTAELRQSKSHTRWLLSASEIKAMNALVDVGPNDVGPATPPVKLDASSPFVQRVKSVLGSPMDSPGFDWTVIGGSNLASASQNAVAFGTKDGATVSVFVQQLNGPAAPFIISDADFQRGYSQTGDGTETLLIQSDPTRRLGVLTITPDGRSVRLIAETSDPTQSPIPFSLDQLRAAEVDLIAADLPVTAS
jgi:hypothetical protein